MKEARKANDMSQEEAAKSFGVSIGTYRNWEQGRVVMNGEQLINAAKLYGTNVDYLLMTDFPQESTKADRGNDLEELAELFESMEEEGREVLMLIARALSERY